jgi:hypothetical protein
LVFVTVRDGDRDTVSTFEVALPAYVTS